MRTRCRASLDAVLTPSQSAIVSETCGWPWRRPRGTSTATTSRRWPGGRGPRPGGHRRAAPRVAGAGHVGRPDRVVGPEDTAAAMGHPDEAVQVLGSPRISLWFELVACELLPEPRRS